MPILSVSQTAAPGRTPAQHRGLVQLVLRVVVTQIRFDILLSPCPNTRHLVAAATASVVRWQRTLAAASRDSCAGTALPP